MKKNQNHYFVLGLMSGTSLDGLDIVAVHFDRSSTGNWSYKIQCAETVAYPLSWVAKLDQAHHLAETEMTLLDEKYTLWLSNLLRKYVEQKQLLDLDAICFTGHTVLHQPEKGITVQLGNLPALAKKLPCPVVCDFRNSDVALGGQGAPLVPVGDLLLFSDYDGCLNLGGFANLSKMKQTPFEAFDVCAFNRVLNPLANKLGQPFDAGGQLAEKGMLIQRLFDALNGLPFYQKSGPKSLGREWVEATLFPLLEDYEAATVEDVLHTYVHHCAFQIGRLWKRGERILITGGGAHNTFFTRLLSTYSEGQFELPDNETINFKEALVFGFLGVLKLRNEVNCLRAVTGAQKDHVAGKIFAR